MKLKLASPPVFPIQKVEALKASPFLQAFLVVSKEEQVHCYVKIGAWGRNGVVYSCVLLSLIDRFGLDFFK